MELRLDRLLENLRNRTQEILSEIDADPLLVKRESGGLVLANASKALFSPQVEYQLYAKGIVYRRDPYQLVSLPLIKIYNVGERDVRVADLSDIAAEPGVRMRFLRKMDGTLIQVFRADGRVWFSTRGMLEGARWQFNEEDEDRLPGFDYIASAREIAQGLYPRLLDEPDVLDGRTLLFELIHPQARQVTNYGEREDLVFLGCFDHRRCAYLTHEAVHQLGARFGLTVVDALSPPGNGLLEQIDGLLASLAGTDEEGSVVCFEARDEVIYRVKVKSPEYLQLMRLLAFCTYERTVEMIEGNSRVRTWEDLRAVLQELGRDRVPEEVLVFYRQFWDRFQAYLANLERLQHWASEECNRIDAEVRREVGGDLGNFRKSFAARAIKSPFSGLLFSALDGRLDLPRLRKAVCSEAEAEQALSIVGRLPGAERVAELPG